MKPRLVAMVGVFLVLNAALVFADDPQQPATTAPGKTAKGKPDRDGAINAPPAKGERLPEKVTVGDVAPDFTLPLISGDKQATLSDSRGKKPVVLTFGSCTCPPFRRNVGEMERLYQSYKDSADFLLVYIREAHPGSQIPGINDGKPIDQTDTLADRMKLANEFARELKLTLPIVVDKEDNQVNAAYAAWPNRLAVVGVDGKLAYLEKSGAGFAPGEMEDWLKNFVGAPAAVTASTDKPSSNTTEIRGKLARVEADHKAITVSVNGSDRTIAVAKNVAVGIAGRTKQADLSRAARILSPGTEVTLTTETKDGQEVVTKITITGKMRKKRS